MPPPAPPTNTPSSLPTRSARAPAALTVAQRASALGLPEGLALAAVTSAARRVVLDVLEYWRALFYYWGRGGTFAGSSGFFAGRPHARLHVHSVALDIRMWNKPHYRTSTYSQDLLDNLRNVAIPGTGVPLSVLARSRALAALFYLVGCPLLALLAALNDARRSDWDGGAAGVAVAYREHLLEPMTWYNFWRMNSRLAAWHAELTQADDYDVENKWTFLQRGAARGVAISPFLRTPALCIKHKNEEGGLGIHFFQNATDGGDWIIQEYLSNSDFVASLLPDNAPLSTFRVITASRGGIAGKSGVEPLSCVFRAGRAGASTDHSAVMFDVDMHTGKIGAGMSNAHWYVLGPQAPMSCRWAPPGAETRHPDTNRVVTGVQLPGFAQMLQTCSRAHELLCPRVPLCGWDLALTKEAGPCLLEVNLSCNFFKGTFDRPAYFKFMEDYARFCESEEAGGAAAGGSAGHLE